jgi:HD-like signal output (HDOD) protein
MGNGGGHIVDGSVAIQVVGMQRSATLVMSQDKGELSRFSRRAVEEKQQWTQRSASLAVSQGKGELSRFSRRTGEEE